MERIVHRAISVDKTKPTEIAVTKAPPMLVTDVITIEKPRHIEVTIAKGSVGINGVDGMDGRNGKDGGVFIPKIVDNSITWNYETTVTEYPSSINMLVGINSITNSEIYSIVNGD